MNPALSFKKNNRELGDVNSITREVRGIEKGERAG